MSEIYNRITSKLEAIHLDIRTISPLYYDELETLKNELKSNYGLTLAYKNEQADTLGADGVGGYYSFSKLIDTEED